MKFSLRELLLIVLIAGLALGWSLDHFQTVRERHKLAEQRLAALEQLNRFDDLIEKGKKFEQLNHLPPNPIDEHPEP
jgi:hypothetical protein